MIIINDIVEMKIKIMMEDLHDNVPSYLAFIGGLVRFVNNGTDPVHVPLSNNVIFLIDSLGDDDSAVLILHIAGGMTPIEISPLTGRSVRLVTKQLKAIQAKLQKPDMIKYLLDANASVIVARTDKGVPIEFDELGLKGGTISFLKKNNIGDYIELSKKTKSDLEELTGASKKYIDDIIVVLATYNQVVGD